MGDTFQKRQKELKRLEKRREKAERRAQKRLSSRTEQHLPTDATTPADEQSGAAIGPVSSQG